MKAVAYVVMEEEMFRLWSVFARETRNESALRSVCFSKIWLHERVLIGVEVQKELWVRGVDSDRI